MLYTMLCTFGVVYILIKNRIPNRPVDIKLKYFVFLISSIAVLVSPSPVVDWLKIKGPLHEGNGN